MAITNPTPNTSATTRIFKSGNSLAVRIPKDMLPAQIPEEAQIEWRNGVWTIRPIHKRSLAGLMDVFRAFPADFMAGGREFHEQKERDWSGVFDPPAMAVPLAHPITPQKSQLETRTKRSTARANKA